MNGEFTLDPKEVLDHLGELGYSNISPDQLKDFIKDLKKLIKYDRKIAEIGKDEDERSDSPQTRDISSPVSTEMSMRSRRPTDRDALRPNIQDNDHVDSKPRGRTKSETRSSRPASSKENLIPTRSSSFIRPWKLQSNMQRPGTCPNRSDPVTLYHKYQALWRQNKVPGEDNHSNLRWNVRERMLGQDPQPRTCKAEQSCCEIDNCICNSIEDVKDSNTGKYEHHVSTIPYNDCKEVVITTSVKI